jgi:ParB family chromosome partitioning protein
VQKKGLGRGLGALLSSGQSSGDEVQLLKLDEIIPNRNQPRQHWDENSLAELASSIEANGLLQPILVRPTAEGKYEIIAGERRWRAGKLADIPSIPALVRTISDTDSLALALIENIQRQDLTILEEAQALVRLKEHCGLTQEQLSTQLGRSRSSIANTLRLVHLSKPVLQALEEEKITAGHGRALAALSPEDQQSVLKIILSRKLTVRDTENLVREWDQPEIASSPSTKNKPHDKKFAASMAETISAKFGPQNRPKILIKGNSEQGSIRLNYVSHEELQAIMALFSSEA